MKRLNGRKEGMDATSSLVAELKNVMLQSFAWKCCQYQPVLDFSSLLLICLFFPSALELDLSSKAGMMGDGNSAFIMTSDFQLSLFGSFFLAALEVDQEIKSHTLRKFHKVDSCTTMTVSRE